MAVCAALLIWGDTKMKRKVNLLIGIVLCLIMVLTSMMSVMAEAGNPGETAPGTETGAVQEEMKTDDSTATDSKAEGEEGSTDAVKNEDDAIAEDKASPSAESEETVAMAPKRLTNKNMMLGTPPSPDTKITKEMDILSAETWTNNFTVDTNGLVRSKVNALTINGSVISNQAVNTAGYNNNTAFIAHNEGLGVVIINGATINNAPGEHDLVTAVKGARFKINNSTINFENGSTGAPYIWSYNGSQDCMIEGTTFKGAGGNNGVILRAGGSNTGDSGKDAKLTLAGSNTFDTVNGSFRALGTIEVTGTTTIKDSTIEIKDGPIYVRKDATLNITNSGITQTYNTNTAGIIVKPGGTLNISGSDLVDTWIRNEGTVNITGTEDDSDKSDLDNCVIKNLNSKLNISNSRLHNCKRETAPNAEGGFDTMIHGTGATITLTNTKIYNNTNTYEKPSPEGVPGASIISVKDGSVTMNGVNAHDNAVNTNGGVMHAVDAEVTIRDSVFTNNSADNQGWKQGDWYGKGGAVFIEDDHAVVTNTVFENNMASEGGALNIKSDKEDDFKSDAAVTDCYFSNNNAARAGGALIIWGDGTEAEIRGCTFTGNTAKNYGGAMATFFDNDATGTLIGASGSGANKKPTRFEGNKVTEGVDFAGGALFLNCAYVRMENAAVYGNYAEDAGGGLSACAIGTAEVHVLEGAAIFGNTVGDSAAVDPDIKNYQDVYFKTKDHIDHETGSYLPGRNDFPYYRFELFERMFNGGVHNWKAKTLSVVDDNHKVASLIAQSNPTKKDIGKADVIFTGNEAHKGTTAKPVSGGAIGCNGLLEIGSGGRTEIKVVKRWDDKSNREKLRPDYSTYISELKVWYEEGGSRHYISLPAVHSNSSGQPAASGYDRETGISVDVFTEGSYAAAGNVAYEDGAVVKANEDGWVIIISGLLEPEKGSYACGESEIIGYQLIDDYSDPERGYFEFTNRYHVPGKTVSVTVNKRWKGDDPLDRPESIEMYLLADGKEILKKTVSASDNWSCTFEGLPYTRGEGDSREVIHYTVVEGSPDNYVPSYKTSREDPYDILETVTNTYHKGYGALTVSKYWDDDNDRGGIRPESIEVSLLRQVGDGPVEDTGKKLVLSKKDNWDPVVFAEIPLTENGETIHYTVKEIAVADGYFAEIDHRFEDHHFAEIFNHLKAGKKGKGNTDTGDRNELAAWCSVLVMAGAGAAVVYSKRRKKKQ